MALASLLCRWLCSAQHWFATHALQHPKRTPKFFTKPEGPLCCQNNKTIQNIKSPCWPGLFPGRLQRSPLKDCLHIPPEACWIWMSLSPGACNSMGLPRAYRRIRVNKAVMWLTRVNLGRWRVFRCFSPNIPKVLPFQRNVRPVRLNIFC